VGLLLASSGVVRTYAPVGKRPILKGISAEITSQLRAPSPLRRQALHETEQERAFKGEDVVRLLKHLMRRIEGKLLLIWDSSAIHRAGAVKDFVSSGASRGLKLEQLPFSTHLISTLRKGS
jgi:hypothetical protein